MSLTVDKSMTDTTWSILSRAGRESLPLATCIRNSSASFLLLMFNPTKCNSWVYPPSKQWMTGDRDYTKSISIESFPIFHNSGMS